MVNRTIQGNNELPFRIIKRVSYSNIEFLLNWLHRDSKRKYPYVADKVFRNYAN